MRIYLDVCCLNRPFDDLSQNRIRLESEAVRLILGRVESRELEWVRSEAVDLEIANTEDNERRRRVTALMSLATGYIAISESASIRAADLMRFGFRSADALHIACAEAAGAEVLLTTDDRLIRGA